MSALSLKETAPKKGDVQILLLGPLTPIYHEIEILDIKGTMLSWCMDPPRTVWQRLSVDLLEETSREIRLPTGESPFKKEFSLIGKRGPGGPYCWICKRSILKQNLDQLLLKGPVETNGKSQCPDCGSKGDAVCFFYWNQSHELVQNICRARPKDPLISNQYGGSLTGAQFLEMLEGSCPLQLIGVKV